MGIFNSTIKDNAGKWCQAFYVAMSEANRLFAQVGDAPLEAILARLAGILVEPLQMPLTWIGLLPPDECQVHILAAAGPAAAYIEDLHISVDPNLPEGQGPASSALRKGEMEILDGIQDPRFAPWRERALAFGLGGSANMPFRTSDGRRGIIVLYRGTDEAFPEGTGDLLARLAQDLSDFLDRREVQADLLRVRALYRALLSEGDLLLSARDERSLLRGTCQRLAQGNLFVAAWIGKPNAENCFEYLAAAGPGAQALQGLRLPIADTPEGRNLAARAWRSGRLQYDQDHLADTRLAPWQDFIRQYAWRSAAAIPVQRGKDLWAVLAVISDRSGVFGGEMLELLSRIALLLGHGLDELDLKMAIIAEREQQAWLAAHDSLTGLPNRRGLEERLVQSMARASRHEHLLAVGMLDIDDFKPINDTYGHALGDRLLRTVAQRLQETLRATDFVARLGGDEFILVMEDLQSLHDLETVLAKIQEAIEAPFLLSSALPEDIRVTVGASLGLTIFPFDEGSSDLLLRHADQALYAIKEEKGRRKRFWRYYQESLGEDTPESSFRSPFASGGLRVYYQPILDLATGRVVGVEALARLADAQGKILSPAEFLPQLNEADQRTLLQGVLARAVEDVASLDQEQTSLWVSVNAVPELLSTPTCIRCLEGILATSPIPPARITLEILEGSDFLSHDVAREHLSAIRATGVRIALDDIGSAYSSLLRLKDLPVDEIKLDQAFVRTLSQNPDGLHFVNALLDLARALKVDFVAEGAETAEILDALAALKVPKAQGYAIAHPMPIAALQVWLAEHALGPGVHPVSLLGLYACHLCHDSTLRKALAQDPTLLACLPLHDAERCPLNARIRRMGLSETAVDAAHREYHRVLAVTAGRMALGGATDWRALDEAERALQDALRTMMRHADRDGSPALPLRSSQ